MLRILGFLTTVWQTSFRKLDQFGLTHDAYISPQAHQHRVPTFYNIFVPVCDEILCLALFPIFSIANEAYWLFGFLLQWLVQTPGAGRTGQQSLAPYSKFRSQSWDMRGPLKEGPGDRMHWTTGQWCSELCLQRIYSMHAHMGIYISKAKWTQSTLYCSFLGPLSNIWVKNNASWLIWCQIVTFNRYFWTPRIWPLVNK